MPKICLVTGASRGLGLEIARALLAAGHHVVATARSVDGLTDKFGVDDRLLTVALDITDRASVSRAVEEVMAKIGGIDVLVNNAGHAQLGFFEMTRDEDIRHEFDVNLFGPMAVTHAVLPHMRKQRSGLLVTISSSSGLVSSGGGSIYSASKFALEGWIEGLAEEVAPFGIKSLVINPGMLRTDFLDGSSARFGVIAIDDYKQADAQFHSFIDGANHQQPGDPKVLANGIAGFVTSDTPPARFVFGDDAVQSIVEKIDRIRAEVDQSSGFTRQG